MNDDKKELIQKTTEDIIEKYGSKFFDGFDFPSAGLSKERANAAYSAALNTFVMGLVLAGVRSIPQLTEAQITSAIRIVDDGLPDEGPYNDYFDTVMQVGQLFLMWLSKQGTLKLSNAQMKAAFQQADKLLEQQQQLDPLTDLEDYAFNNDDPDRKDYHYDNPKLPKFNLAMAAQIRMRIGPLVSTFVIDGPLKKVLGQVNTATRDDIGIYLIGLAEHMYGEYRRTPSRWSQKTLRGVLTGYFVKDALIFPDEYPQVASILKAFMDFCAEKKFITGSMADLMKRGIDKYAPEMVKLGADEANFSQRKRDNLAAMDEKHVYQD